MFLATFLGCLLIEILTHLFYQKITVKKYFYVFNILITRATTAIYGLLCYCSNLNIFNYNAETTMYFLDGRLSNIFYFNHFQSRILSGNINIMMLSLLDCMKKYYKLTYFTVLLVVTLAKPGKYLSSRCFSTFL